MARLLSRKTCGGWAAFVKANLNVRGLAHLYGRQNASVKMLTTERRSYSLSGSCLPPSCLSFANTAPTSISPGFLSASAAATSASLRAVVSAAGSNVAPASTAAGFSLLARLHLEIEVGLRAQAERHRIHWRETGGVPVRALADRRDRRFGGADEPHDRAVFQLRMVAHQPQDRVRPVLPARHRRVARALLAAFGGAPAARPLAASA